MEKIIKLSKMDGSWVADFVNDGEVKRLFGTTIIPTPYESERDIIYVWAEVQKRNPGHRVVIA